MSRRSKAAVRISAVTLLAALMTLVFYCIAFAAATAAQVKVEIVSFTLNPAQPKIGETVTLTMTVKNTGTAALTKVPWAIYHYTGRQMLAWGDKVALNPGNTATLTAKWSAKSGEQIFQGYLDSQGTIRNTAPPVSTNKVVRLNISTAATSTAAPVSTSTSGIVGQPRRNDSVPLSERARIDADKFKQNMNVQIQNSGLSTEMDKGKNSPFSGLTGRKQGSSEGGQQQGNSPGGQHQGTQGGGMWVGQDNAGGSGGAGKGKGVDIGGKPVVTGSRHGDTFGGDRINRGHTGSTRDFKGGGQGNARSDDDDGMSGQSGADADTVASMLEAEGGKSSGDVNKDRSELGYAQSVGTDGYKATKDMSSKQREEYWQNKEKEQKGKPREDDAGGSFRPVTWQEVNREVKGINSRKGQAGGGNNPRDDNQGGGGTKTIVGGKDDRPEKERSGGQINMDKVLEINQVINPTRQ